jgi:PAS domain S-box-containing protein
MAERALDALLTELAAQLPGLGAELFEGLSLGVVVACVDPGSPWAWVNAAAREILGTGSEGGVVHSLVEVADRMLPTPGTTEYRLRHAQGHFVWVEIYSLPLRARPRPVVLWILQDISERKRAEAELLEERRQLRERAEEQDRQNAELRELIHQVALERGRQRQLVEANARLLLLPQVERLAERATPELRPAVHALRVGLEQLGSELGLVLEREQPKLTSREREICALIRGGMRTKQIAQALGLSVRSVEAHRYNIRSKLGLRGRGANLASHLAYMDKGGTQGT